MTTCWQADLDILRQCRTEIRQQYQFTFFILRWQNSLSNEQLIALITDFEINFVTRVSIQCQAKQVGPYPDLLTWNWIELGPSQWKGCREIHFPSVVDTLINYLIIYV